MTGRINHVAAPLGKIYMVGEDGKKYHLMFMSLVAASDLKCQVWMEWLVEW
jgi:hypothetical protein